MTSVNKTAHFATWVALYLFIGLACSINYRPANDRAVERLRQELLNEKFSEIYDGTSSITKAQVRHEEFAEKMKGVTGMLKSIDKELKWRRDERGSPEEAVYRDDNWSSLILEKDGRRVDISLDWDTTTDLSFALCGMSISGDIPEGGNSRL